jgi:hypothetical protein
MGRMFLSYNEMYLTLFNINSYFFVNCQDYFENKDKTTSMAQKKNKKKEHQRNLLQVFFWHKIYNKSK